MNEASILNDDVDDVHDFDDNKHEVEMFLIIGEEKVRIEKIEILLFKKFNI